MCHKNFSFNSSDFQKKTEKSFSQHHTIEKENRQKYKVSVYPKHAIEFIDTFQLFPSLAHIFIKFPILMQGKIEDLSKPKIQYYRNWYGKIDRHYHKYVFFGLSQ